MTENQTIALFTSCGIFSHSNYFNLLYHHHVDIVCHYNVISSKGTLPTLRTWEDSLEINYGVSPKFKFNRNVTFLSFCKQSEESQLQKANVLLEFGEWLYQQNFSKDDGKQQVQLAIDILLRTESDMTGEAGITSSGFYFF